MRPGYGPRMAEYGESKAGYALTRRGDPRIAAAIERALGDASTVVNVGAGAGSYESEELDVTAVEPSATMRAQRAAGSAPVIDARAESLPFEDASFDAATAILTIHHWEDARRGLAELLRVARGPVVVLTFDASRMDAFWFVRDYLPEAAELDRGRIPSIEATVRWLGGRADVLAVPIPHDCRDGFLGAFWRRPGLYLDPAVRAGMSVFDALPPGVTRSALARLRDDLDSGAWQQRHAGLLALDELDLGYRLVVARPHG
jgi:SAM-dependent methyltransferase